MNKHSSKCFYSSVWQSSLHLLPLLLFLLNLFLSSFSSFLHLTSFPLPLSPSLLFTSSLSISVYSFSPPISPSPSLSALSSTSSLTISFSSFLHLYVLLLLFSLSTPPPSSNQDLTQNARSCPGFHLCNHVTGRTMSVGSVAATLWNPAWGSADEGGWALGVGRVDLTAPYPDEDDASSETLSSCSQMS